MNKIKQVKLKKVKPRGKLYRLEVLANVADPPRDPDAVVLEGSCLIYTDEGVHFARLYPVKEEAKQSK